MTRDELETWCQSHGVAVDVLDTVTVESFARMVDRSEDTIKRWRAEGKVQGEKRFGKWRFKLAVVVDVINKGTEVD